MACRKLSRSKMLLTCAWMIETWRNQFICQQWRKDTQRLDSKKNMIWYFLGVEGSADPLLLFLIVIFKFNNIQSNKHVDLDFKNLSKYVLDQKQTNLCVAIAVTTLLRYCVCKHEEKTDDQLNKEIAFEKMLTRICMEIYPRSMTGLNLNPKPEEMEYQTNDVLTLLERLKYETYLSKSGWDILKQLGLMSGTFNFEEGEDY